MAGWSVPSLDYSWMGDVAKSVGGGINQYATNKVIKDAWAKSGGDYSLALKDLIAAGYPDAAKQLSGITNQGLTPWQQADLALRTQTQNAKAPPTTTAGNQTMQYVNGQWQPLGGPKTKELSVSDADKLAEHGAQSGGLDELMSTFKPSYGGYAFPGRLTAAERGFAMDPNDSAAADWWKNYNLWAEGAKHDLYSSQVSKEDRADFVNNRISPTTDPTLIPKSLTAQKNVIDRLNAKRAKTLEASGYNPAAINEALGVPGTSTNPQEDQLRKWADEAIAAGADRNAVQQRLQQMLNGQ